MTGRAGLLKTASILALLTIGYNFVEGMVSVWFGVADETISLFGFGLDSFVEVASGIGVWHMVGRMKAQNATEQDAFEQRALRITGASFYLLAAGLVVTAAVNTIERHRPQATIAGMIVAAISIVSMQLLIHYKVKVGKGAELSRHPCRCSLHQGLPLSLYHTACCKRRLSPYRHRLARLGRSCRNRMVFTEGGKRGLPKGERACLLLRRRMQQGCIEQA